MKLKSRIILLTSLSTLLLINGCGKQASSHSQSSSNSLKVSKTSSSSSSASNSNSTDTVSSSDNSDSSNNSSSSSNNSSVTFPTNWTSSVPTAVSGTWKGNKIEFVFSKSVADFQNSDSGMWVGGSWNPKYKYLGDNTYEVVAGNQDNTGNTNYYKIHVTDNNAAQIYASMNSSFSEGGPTTVTRVSDKVTDHG